MAAYDLACRVDRRGTFLLTVFLLTEAGGVVSPPMRLSAVLPYLFYSFRFVLTATMLLIAISALSTATTR